MTRTPLHLTPADAEDAAAGLHHDDTTLRGTVRAFVERSDQLDALAESPHEVVLYGRISGTTVVRRVP